MPDYPVLAKRLDERQMGRESESCITVAMPIAGIAMVCSIGSSPHFSPRGEMIAQRFGFTVDFLKERNTDCISD
ncbi:MAG: hypothetical protein ABFS22_03775, partial [Pseudomonadota bacterium]